MIAIVTRGLRASGKQQVPHPPGKGGGFGMTRFVCALANIIDELRWPARVDRREIPPLRGAARSQERTRQKRPRRSGRNDRFEWTVGVGGKIR